MMGRYFAFSHQPFGNNNGSTVLVVLKSYLVIFCGLLCAAGCGGSWAPRSDEDIKKISGRDIKEVVPVSGTVTIDGDGQEGIVISLHKKGDTAVVHQSHTEEGGKYCWTTYRLCDGLEDGTYTLTFKYIPNMKPNGKGDDLLKGRYADPKKSQFELTVELGQPQQSADYELNME
jgi:hypothetical protein